MQQRRIDLDTGIATPKYARTIALCKENLVQRSFQAPDGFTCPLLIGDCKALAGSSVKRAIQIPVSWIPLWPFLTVYAAWPGLNFPAS